MPELKPFQRVGRDFLARTPRALLADQMRLGKTWQAIAAADKLGARRVLVVCPAIARAVWKNTFRELSPKRRAVANVEHTLPGWLESSSDLVAVASYEQARNRKKDLVKGRWDVLIVDESHYCKTPGAQRTKTVFGKGGLVWRAKRVWAMSGTPAPNNASELWVMLRVFGVVKMGYRDFCNRYCYVDWRGKPTGTRKDRVLELRKLLSKVMLRRTKAEVAPDLPEYSVEPWYVEADPDFVDLMNPAKPDILLRRARRAEARLKQELEEIPPEKRAAFLAAKATRDSNYAEVRRVNGLLKAPAVYETVKFEIETDLVDKIVLFAYHRQVITSLYQMLKGKGIKAEMVYGGTPQKKKDAAVRRFSRPSKEGGSRVFIGQITAAGTAIDLSAAHEGIMVEKDWTPGNNEQALERMGGFKQTQPITIRDATLPGGVDEMTNQALNRKMAELGWIFN